MPQSASRALGSLSSSLAILRLLPVPLLLIPAGLLLKPALFVDEPSLLLVLSALDFPLLILALSEYSGISGNGSANDDVDKSVAERAVC
jgi:hypothetical protein